MSERRDISKDNVAGVRGLLGNEVPNERVHEEEDSRGGEMYQWSQCPCYSHQGPVNSDRGRESLKKPLFMYPNSSYIAVVSSYMQNILKYGSLQYMF